MAELKIEAIILGSYVYAEADQIVVLFSRKQGKLRALAKNAKKSQKRFMNCFDGYGLVRAVLVRKSGRDLHRLDSCRLIARPAVGADPLKLGLAGLAAEAVNIFCPEGQPDEVLFLSLRTVLFGLVQSAHPLGLGLAFLLRLLHQTGFGPNLEACRKCGKGLDELKGALFDRHSGGLTCRSCGANGPDISLGGLKTIRLCQQMDPAGLTRIRFPARDEELIFDLTASYLAHTAGREVKSLGFLEKVGWRKKH